MKVFIDTNILIDILCKREPFVDDALTLFDWAIDGKIDMIVSDLTIANVKYITRKELSTEKFYEVILAFRPVITIVPIGEWAVDKALALKADDFEDALQYFSAAQATADCLVTRNIKDYGFAKMKVCTPHDFIDTYKSYGNADSD